MAFGSRCPSEMPQITANPVGPGFRLTMELELPAPRQTIYDFFSDAFGLEALTPPWLNFHVSTQAPIQLQPGTLIDYKLRIHGVPLRWQSKISVWEPPHRFVDEQLRGPYRRWHHEHLFEETATGTLVRDVVHYEVPGGRLVHSLFVKPDLMKIFAYRRAKLLELFTR
jgi:ligand-binding SRPBCC domain-containing protein